MRYLIGTLGGLGSIAGGAMAVGYGWYAMIRRIGVCGSAPDLAPDGCVALANLPLVYVIFGGIAVAMIGIPLFALRGAPPGGEGRRWALTDGERGALLVMQGMFLALAAAGVASTWGPAAVPGPSVVWLLTLPSAVLALASVPLLFVKRDSALARRLGRYRTSQRGAEAWGGAGDAERGPIEARSGRALNPLPLLVSVVALVGGALGGLALAREPLSVYTSLELTGEPIKAGDAESRFQPGPLRAAVADAAAELGTEPIRFVRIKPREIKVKTGSSPLRDPVPISELPIGAPARMLAGMNRILVEAGESAVGYEQVLSFTWRPDDPSGNDWMAVLHPERGRTEVFTARADGSGVAPQEQGAPRGAQSFGAG